MGLPCLAPLFSRLTHLLSNNEGTSWTDRCHLTQERMKGAFRHKKISLQMLRRKRQTPSQSHDTNNLVSRQHSSMLYATRYEPSCTTKRRSKEPVYHHVVPAPVAIPYYIDRACQTDFCQTSPPSTDDLVFARALDECRIPDGRPPPPYAPRDDFRL
ncbi:hypothetical protein FPOA_12195 [Fusarium poae]|uniref:Uncharacterized protein n=1 Tax=Fusarium poae TaxID=36050 RepID=A0A1B8A9I5_FUSPO|nr:hypothetical protein FPOA_12338 [Fusarium poae]OBS17155.1 hypothetical protein FPOA_12333 [Fusarium poae]OBS17299.1 hypothetical protein FPOA_12195 [Fusarium poae]